ncbi:DUF7711 family protein [Amycolatopsis sp.]|uniref:DUF7711 family protein n=1 Tax=Amycolatopsis sp. TaxID=37632 RepID=UPI003BB8F742
MPWCWQPSGTAWLVDNLRPDKGDIAYWWRSRHQPVGNHVIRDPSASPAARSSRRRVPTGGS